jgi:hypothetical protein
MWEVTNLDPIDRSSLYLKSEQWHKALADLSKAIELAPYNFEMVYTKRGAAYIAAKQYDLAIADLDIAIKFHKDDHFALNNRGVAQAKKGNYSLAVDDFSKSSFIIKTFYRGGLHNFVVANLGQASLEMGHYIMAYNTSVEVARDAKDPDLIAKAKWNIRQMTGKDRPSKGDVLLELLTIKRLIIGWFSKGKSLMEIEIELKLPVGVIRSLIDKTEWVAVFDKKRVKLIPIRLVSVHYKSIKKKSLEKVMRMVRKRRLQIVLQENINTESSLSFDASGLLTEASVVKILSEWTLGYIKEKPLNITHPFGKTEPMHDMVMERNQMHRTNLQERKKHNHLPSVEEEAY